jgi:hypothetical protein
MPELSKILPLLIPLIILQFGLQIAALVNLYRRKKVRFNNKAVWVIIILLGSMVGSIIYFIAKGDDE